MRVWRLTRQRHVSTAFEGIGSERVGGRWSPRGLRVVYTSESIALCVLELLVHWVKRRQTAILKVPSAIVPYEYNYILNPAHSDFCRLQIGSPQRFRFDTRLWKMS